MMLTGKHLLLFVTLRLFFVAVGSGTSSHGLGGTAAKREDSAAFFHHRRRSLVVRPQSPSSSFLGRQRQSSPRKQAARRGDPTAPRPPASGTKLRALAEDDGYAAGVPLFDDYGGGSLPVPPPKSPSSSWEVGDDWSRLSSAADAFSSSSSSLSIGDGGFDAMDEAALLMEEHEKIMGEWAGGEGGGEGGSAAAMSHYPAGHVKASGDDFVEDAIEAISGNYDYDDPGVQLYDTRSSLMTRVKSEEDCEEEEMALMIRCGKSPHNFLVSQGRALPELTDDMKYAASFLLEERPVDEVADSSEDGSSMLSILPKATSFFLKAVQKIFDAHSIELEEGSSVLDRNAISRWITRCISSPFGPSIAHGGKPTRKIGSSPVRQVVIGPYDKSVSAILSRYSNSHGSGRLTLDEFKMLYLEVAWAGHIRDIIKRRETFGMQGRVPSVDAGVLIRGRKNTEKMLNQASLRIIWRDLEVHDIFSPAEEERVELIREIERARTAQATTTTAVAGLGHSSPLMDECIFFDEYEDRLFHQTYSHENDDDDLEERAWGPMKERRARGSHESVEMASDGVTPKRIRDGEFVFIDEESCIGCVQCAAIAPSSFQMLEETGRARTYFQRSSLDVENAVMSCPVNCMHMMSFDELKEMEVSRDNGDGRTDHRHFGGGRAHTPLHVSGRDSDANHKSSWYHYLKGKCHGSSTCPQRGCYDCPTYAPGQNPHFKERHRLAELARARDFMESGEADRWRKVVEL